MLTVEVKLRCDGCKVLYGKFPWHLVPVLRKTLEELRVEAGRNGWAHYRLTNNAPNGDYCPRCVKLHRERGEK